VLGFHKLVATFRAGIEVLKSQTLQFKRESIARFRHYSLQGLTLPLSGRQGAEGPVAERWGWPVHSGACSKALRDENSQWHAPHLPKSDTLLIKIDGAQKLGFRTFGVLRRRVLSLSRMLQRLTIPAKGHS
jgi:hypothetical protein